MIRLVPKREAPKAINVSASSNDEIPPAALILTPSPTYFAITSTSSNVAPAVEKPVEVLIKSAPERVTTPQSSISSSLVN